MKKLVLIDSNAMMHRAYHAMPPLTNTKGEPVNAVYGFFSILLQILNSEKPDYLAFCFDRTKPTIRQSMYAGYHAHRPEMESDLSSQFGLVDGLLQKLKAPEFSLDGYEGDDMIGTIATKVQKTQSTQRARKPDRQKIRNSDKSDIQTNRRTEFSESSENIETIIVTGDRDMLQLVDGNTKVLMPQNGLGKTILFDSKAVEEKYGVKPAQFVDYKALIGDPSDGYPGVTGIGPKTAANLLQEFGTFEDLYMKIDKLPEKTALKLATDAEQAALAKRLAAIVTDAPMQFRIEDCKVANFDFPALKKGFAAHGFKTITARYEAAFPEVKKPESDQLGLL